MVLIMERIHHTIRSTGQTFTFEQWCEHLAKEERGEISRIATEYNGFHFNDFDICLNPKTTTIAVQRAKFYSAIIKLAECRGGRWNFGIDISCGTGGGGYGCSWVEGNDGFPSEREATIAAIGEAIVRCRNMYGHAYHEDDKHILRLIEMLEDYRKTLTRPQVIQLSLFD